MNSNDVKALKAGAWYTVASFITKGAAFITTPIFARLLSKSAMGVTSNVSAWMLLLLPLFSFDFYTSVKIARFDFEEEIDKYCGSILVYGSVITLLFYAIALLFIDPVCSLLEVSRVQLHVMFLYFLVYPAISIFQTKSLLYYQYKVSTLLSVGSFIMSTLMGIVFVIFCEDKATGRIIGVRGTYILISLFVYYYLLKRSGGISLKYFKYAAKISFPLIWHTLSLHLLTSCDRIIITKCVGTEAAALYAVAYSSAHAISVFFHSMSNAWAPWALVQIHENNVEKHKSASRIYLFCFTYILFGLLLISPEILLILGGIKYMEAVYVIPPALLSVLPQMLYTLYVNAENYQKKQNYIAVGTTAAALLNLVLNLIFIPKYGYIAAAYTTYAGYFCLYLFHYYITMKIGMKRFFDNKLYISVAILSLLFIPASNWLYGHTRMRFTVFAVYCVVLIAAVYRFRAEILSLIRLFLKIKKTDKGERSAEDRSE